MATERKWDKISDLHMENRPHVVILGAGASRAAFPNGDRHGYPLPLMTDLIQLIGLDDLVDDLDLEHYTTNFEEIYSHCHESGQVEIMKEMERRTYNYFDDMGIGMSYSLRLPDLVTARERPDCYIQLGPLAGASGGKEL